MSGVALAAFNPRLRSGLMHCADAPNGDSERFDKRVLDDAVVACRWIDRKQVKRGRIRS